MGSCARNVIRLRRMFFETLAMLIPSIVTVPLDKGVVARSESARVLLPEPVRPTIEVWVPPGRVAVMERMAGGEVGVYCTVTSTKVTGELGRGQSGGGVVVPGSSGST